ncbi:MAG: hypothetical protein D6805_05945 [Planctomycetota bacterium]|nr:MAG: hypothetical protein D6805_05945 [Planctomycetota bacterium]
MEQFLLNLTGNIRVFSTFPLALGRRVGNGRAPGTEKTPPNYKWIVAICRMVEVCLFYPPHPGWGI